jgi:hypothetical protein
MSVVLSKVCGSSARFVILFLQRSALRLMAVIDVSPMRIFAVGNDALAVVTADGDAAEQVTVYAKPSWAPQDREDWPRWAATKAEFDVPRGAVIALTDEHLCIAAVDVCYARSVHAAVLW